MADHAFRGWRRVHHVWGRIVRPNRGTGRQQAPGRLARMDDMALSGGPLSIVFYLQGSGPTAFPRANLGRWGNLTRQRGYLLT